MEYKAEYQQQNNIKDIKLLKKGTESNNENSDVDHENCIGQLDENTKLGELIMVHAHDAGTKDMILPSPFGIFSKIAERFGNLPQKIASCQILSLGEQLKKGARCFDLRFRKVKKQWHFFHGPTISREPVNDQLKEILKFVDDHPKEIIFLTIWMDDWNEWENLKNQEQFKLLMDHSFSPSNTEKKHLSDYTIKNITKRKKNIIMISGKDSNKKSKEDLLFTEDNDYLRHWTDLGDGSDSMEAKFNEFKLVISQYTVKQDKNIDNIMFGIQFPNTTGRKKLRKFFTFTNKTSIFPLKDAAETTKKICNKTLGWLKNNPGMKKPNSFWLDGIGIPSVDEAIDDILKLNYQQNKSKKG